MKTLMTAILVAGFIPNMAFAREAKATLCAEKAERAALALYQLNNPKVSDIGTTLTLIEMDHSEGGHEIWDVNFLDDRGHSISSPYRIGVVIDDCVVYSFSMPTAG